MKFNEIVAFCLPRTGRRTQFFHLIFTEPGNHTLAQPCTTTAAWMEWKWGRQTDSPREEEREGGRKEAALVSDVIYAATAEWQTRFHSYYRDALKGGAQVM